MSVALKFNSFAALLQTSGVGGDSGDRGCNAPIHAVVAAPTSENARAPPGASGGGSGNEANAGGVSNAQHLCGFQEHVPTIPTIPAVLRAVACRLCLPPVETSRVHVAQPAAWRELAGRYFAHHFNCPHCICAGQNPIEGRRCDQGMALWQAYEGTFAAPA